MDRLFINKAEISQEDLVEGGFFLVNKPLGWTSFDVVNKLRYAIRSKLDKKKYKIGHSGTLDPLATGLLIICFSKYTKLIESMTGWDKTYTGTMRVWATTPSYDAEHPIDTYYPQSRFESVEIEKKRNTFLGPIDQYPPIFSAIKKNGIPLYRLARKGVKVEIKSRKVEIKKFSITNISLPFIDFKVECSKGTYIRSLAYDFGRSLNNGAYLSGLVRTSIGQYELDDAWEVQELADSINSI